MSTLFFTQKLERSTLMNPQTQYVMHLDDEGNIKFINRHFLEESLYPQDDLSGQYFSMITVPADCMVWEMMLIFYLKAVGDKHGFYPIPLAHHTVRFSLLSFNPDRLVS